MEVDNLFVNKIAESGLITIDLSKYIPNQEVIGFDIEPHLFQGLILKEKDFRAFVKEHDWNIYSGKNIAIFCSADAIVPTWAYMLISSKLALLAHRVTFGEVEIMNTLLFDEALRNLDLTTYQDQRIVIKGCSDIRIPVSAYVLLTALLIPIAKSIMYGEPCSTVPLFKRKD